MNNNWLSDLGDRSLNPDGAVFYRLGCAFAGVLMAALFLSLTPWRLEAKRRQRRLVGWSAGRSCTASLQPWLL